jgi:TonB-dependent receptor
MSNYSLVKFTNAIQDINDREYSLAANLKLPVNWFSQEEETFKLGYSDRQRTRDVSGVNFSYKNLPNLTAAQASYGGNVNFYNSQYDNGPNLTPGYLQNLLANNQYISNSNAINNALQYQNDKENVFATYGQYQTKINNIGIIGGLRFEGTNATYAANAKGVNAQQNTIVSPVSQNAKYNNLFPSLQARIDLKDSTILRVAYSSTIARPGFNEVTPSLNIDPSANQVVQGNPNLKPTTSNAFDLAYEHYLPAAGIFSVGFFDKEISNYIAPSRTDATFPNNGLFAGFVGIAHVVSYSNIANSHARGFELNYYEHLKNLPESLDGLGIGFNYTYVDSKFQIRPGEFSTLPSTSKNTVNGTLFYETDHLNLRLGLYYLSSNLWAIGSGDTPDTFSAPRFNVDFGGSYIFDKQYSLYFNIKNITNTPLTFYEGTPDRVIQREFYGPTYQFGLNFAL